MKRILELTLAGALLLATTVPAWCDNTASSSITHAIESTEGQALTYTTAAVDNDNFARLSIHGSLLTIARRSSYLHWQDQISMVQSGVVFLEQTNSWAPLPQTGVYSGYDTTIDLSSLPAGTYALDIKSVGSAYLYPFLSLTLLKNDSGCSIADIETMARQHNYGLLHQLANGNAPDDFSTLTALYNSEEDREILERIRATTLSIITGCTSEKEKATAIYRWIADNIAYDVEISGTNYDAWIATHPDDAIRLDDPLHAFTQQYGLCYGFSKLAVLMMGYAGMDCVYITGRLADQNTDINTPATDLYHELNHAWNAVKVDGTWQWMDVSQDAVHYYRRQNPELASTGYREVVRDAVYLNLFPSLNYLSKDRIAVRLGAKGYGVKVQGLSVPESGTLASVSCVEMGAAMP